MPEAHSLYSASGYQAAMLCPGKVVLEQGKPNRSSIHAATGTVAHAVLEDCLKHGHAPADKLNDQHQQDGFDIVVDQDMVNAVQTAIGNIRDIVGDGMLLTEQRVNYSAYLGVPEDEAWGTSDIIAARGTELQVHDYKHGQGVAVDAENNVQMMLYAGGALAAVNDVLGPFDTVRMVIHQPRIQAAPSEWVIPVAQLEEWLRTTARSATITRQNAVQLHTLGDNAEWEDTFLRPGDKQCRFCRAKAECPALRQETAGVAFGDAAMSADEFAEAQAPVVSADSPDAWLVAIDSKADLIDGFLTAVRAEIERRLLAGKSVPGRKLVQGKRGNRAWADPLAAEKLLREVFRLKIEQAYDLKLISPTSAEKLHKAGTIGPRQWPKAVALITQADGKPSVAPLSDPRPALDVRPVVDDFTDASEFA